MPITAKELNMIWAAVLCQYCEFSKKEDADSKAVAAEHSILLKKLQAVIDNQRKSYSIR